MRMLSALVYLDDVFLVSRNADEHMLHVRALLSLLHKAGVTIIRKKWKFFSEKNYYLDI